MDFGRWRHRRYSWLRCKWNLRSRKAIRLAWDLSEEIYAQGTLNLHVRLIRRIRTKMPQKHMMLNLAAAEEAGEIIFHEPTVVYRYEDSSPVATVGEAVKYET